MFSNKINDEFFINVLKEPNLKHVLFLVGYLILTLNKVKYKFQFTSYNNIYY